MLWFIKQKNKDTNQKVAIKKISNDQSQKVILTAIDCCRLLKNLQYYDFFIEVNDICIVMELLEDYGTLHHRSNSMRNNLHIKNPKTIETFKTIFSGIDFLHSIGLAYNDLHLSNILIDEETDEPKIIDLSCTRLSAHLRPIQESYGDPDILCLV